MPTATAGKPVKRQTIPTGRKAENFIRLSGAPFNEGDTLKGRDVQENRSAVTLRVPIADDLQEHLHKPFSELPTALAERVRQAFEGVLLDRRDAALIWDEATPEQRNNAAVAADESAAHMAQVFDYEEEKRKAGRYTLEEAAKLIASNGDASEEQMLAKLEKAARNHAMPTYLPGHNVTTEYGDGPGKTRTVSAYYDECYWADLNKWLDENEPRVSFRFGHKQAIQHVVADKAIEQIPSDLSEVDEALHDGITFQEVAELLRSRVSATSAELAMWIFQQDLRVWAGRRDQRNDSITPAGRFNLSDLGAPSNAESAVQRFITCAVLLSKSEVNEFQPSERYLDYATARRRIEQASGTDAPAILIEWERIHREIRRTNIVGSYPMVAAVIPGAGYAERLEDGLIFEDELQAFLKDRIALQNSPPVGIGRALSPVSDASGLTKREKQIRAIIAEAVKQGFDVLHIPDGGKTQLRNLCIEKMPKLFGAGHSPFDDAWKEAARSDPPRLRMANRDKFAGG